MLSRRDSIKAALASARVELKPHEVHFIWATGFGLKIVAVSTALGAVQIQAWGEKLGPERAIIQFPIWLALDEIEAYVQHGIALISPSQTTNVVVSEK